MKYEDNVNISEKSKKSVKKINIPYSEKAKENLKRNQSRYMKKNGQNIRLDYLAGILLETATL